MGAETWLTPEEVEELTAKKRWSVQCRTLADMGIPFLPNAVGRPLVERAAVLSSPAPQAGQSRQRRPDWAAYKDARTRGKAA